MSPCSETSCRSCSPFRSTLIMSTAKTGSVRSKFNLLYILICFFKCNQVSYSSCMRPYLQMHSLSSDNWYVYMCKYVIFKLVLQMFVDMYIGISNMKQRETQVCILCVAIYAHSGSSSRYSRSPTNTKVWLQILMSVCLLTIILSNNINAYIEL